MNTLPKGYARLRRKNMSSYGLLLVCNFISVLLIAAFGVVMQSGTVQTMLPEGGDSRKQMTMIFVLAIVGCAVFTVYASTLFLRSKSREMGILMALGVRKRTLASLLFGDLALVALSSSALGILLGTPLAAGIWGLFRLLVVDSGDMVFSIRLSGYLCPLAFSVFSMAALFTMGVRFIHRSNILDVIGEGRKSEPVGNVRGWYGIGGILLMVVGVSGAVIVPNLFASMGYAPPFWSSLLYLPAAAGLYLLLVFVVVRGVGGKKKFYQQIISRSMMRFQGRQTVLNMCVMTVLMMAGAMFYTPMNMAPAMLRLDDRPMDYAFHHRVDEPGIPDRTTIEEIAEEMGVVLQDYADTEFIRLAADGFDREWTEDGRFGNEYHSFYTEESFLSASAFQTVSGISVTVQPGKYVFVAQNDYRHNPYDYIEDMQRFTNPVTMQTLEVSFQEEIHYDMLHRYILLNDDDYATITTGLTDEWRERWVQFNVQDADASYLFAKQLKNTIIDGSTQLSAVYENYDRIERMNAHAAGEEYRGDVDPDLQVDYAARDSSHFNQYWRYIPQFRVAERQEFVMNMSVYLMLFVFMALICLAAVIVTAYTRCITIAVTNRQVYDDLRHLGAKRDYLYRSVRGQVSKVFAIPAIIGTVGVSGFFALLMYANSGGFEPGELVAFAIDAVLIVATSLLLWVVYWITLRRVSALLGVEVK